MSNKNSVYDLMRKRRFLAMGVNPIILFICGFLFTVPTLGVWISLMEIPKNLSDRVQILIAVATYLSIIMALFINIGIESWRYYRDKEYRQSVEFGALAAVPQELAAIHRFLEGVSSWIVDLNQIRIGRKPKNKDEIRSVSIPSDEIKNLSENISKLPDNIAISVLKTIHSIQILTSELLDIQRELLKLNQDNDRFTFIGSHDFNRLRNRLGHALLCVDDAFKNIREVAGSPFDRDKNSINNRLQWVEGLDEEFE